MFDLLNEIEDCPATVLSANRNLISKCEVKLLTQKPSADNTKIIYKIDDLTFTLFLFTDLILVIIIMSLFYLLLHYTHTHLVR